MNPFDGIPDAPDFSDVQGGASAGFANPFDEVDPQEEARRRKRREIAATWGAAARGENEGLGGVPVPDTSPSAVLASTVDLAGATAANANVAAANLPRTVLTGMEEMVNRAAKPYREASGQDQREAAAREWLAQRFSDHPLMPLEATLAGNQLGPQSRVPDPLGPVQEMTQRAQDAATVRLAEASTNLPAPLAATAFWGGTTAGMLADASQYVGGRMGEPFGSGPGALRAAAAREAALSAADVTPEEAAYLARRAEAMRAMPGATEAPLRPGAIADAMQPERSILQVGEHADDLSQDVALGLRARPQDAADAAELSRISQAIGERPPSLDDNLPLAGPVVDGRVVRPEIPNAGSIGSSLDSYEVLPGVREIPMSHFDPEYTPSPYSVSERARLDDLVAQLKQSKEINPLIVVYDAEQHPYILEGGHRFDALKTIGAKSLPAKVVIDTSETSAEEVAQRLAARLPRQEPPPLAEIFGEPQGGRELTTTADSLPLRPQATGSIAAPEPPLPPVRSGTKALTNVAGLQGEFRDLVEKHADVIEAARGARTPVSVWHDAQGLADDLGMTREDFLNSPGGRIFNAQEVSLAKHYMGGMKQEISDLSKRLAAGEIPEAERAAAVARLDSLNTDTVRMMAVVQKQFSEAGRTLRSGQELLGPFDGTPDLKAALVKRYSARAADEAAAAEDAAMKKALGLQRSTFRRAAKTDLDAEYERLAAELDKRAAENQSKAFMSGGLDPASVKLITQMARNRVQAGVTSLPEVVQTIHERIAPSIPGLEPVEVRDAISGYGKATATRTQSETAAALARIREQGRLVSKIEALQEGEALPASQAKPKPDATTAALREKLRQTVRDLGLAKTRPETERLAAVERQLRLRIADAERGIGPSRAPRLSDTPEITALRQQLQQTLEEHGLAPGKGGRKLTDAQRLAALKSRLAKEEATLTAQLESKVFPQPAKRPEVPLDAEATALKDRVEGLRADKAASPHAALSRRYGGLSDDVIQQIARLPDDPGDPALLNFLRSMERPTFRDYMGALSYHFMLSGPKSMVRNVLGNTVKRWTDLAMKPIEAGVEAPLARLQGRVPERFIQETLPAVVGNYCGASKGLEKALFVLKNGYDPERLVGELTGTGASKWETGGRLPLDPFLLSQNRLVRGIGRVTSYGPTIMNAGDVMAKARAATSANYAWATRKAIQDVRAGLASSVEDRAAQYLMDQPDEMLKFSEEAARRATYQDQMSAFGRAVSQLRRVPGPPGTMASYMMPFVHVSDRVGAFLLDFTPGARSLAIYKAAKEGSPVASDLIARQLVGSAFAAAATGWAFHGKLTGSMSRMDPKLRNDAYAAGKQPYSVLVGDHWVPIRDTFGGLAGPVVAAAAFHDQMTTGEPVDAAAIARAAGGSVIGEARYLLDASYLQSLSQAVSAIEASPDQAGQEAANLAARTGEGFYVPFSGLLRNVATARDLRVVDAQGPLDTFKSAIPGLRETLPAKLDSMGHELVANTGAAGGFLPFVPTRSTIADPQLADDVSRLRYTVGLHATGLNAAEKRQEAAWQAVDVAKPEDRARLLAQAQKLVAENPKADWAKWVRKQTEDVHKLEEELRQVKANAVISPAAKRKIELELDQQMKLILQGTLNAINQPVGAPP